MNEETKDLIRKQFEHILKHRKHGYLEVHDHMMGCFATLLRLRMVDDGDTIKFVVDLNKWFYETPDALKELHCASVGCGKA